MFSKACLSPIVVAVAMKRTEADVCRRGHHGADGVKTHRATARQCNSGVQALWR